MKRLIHLVLGLVLLNGLYVSIAGADIPPEPGEKRGEGATARLRREMREQCAGKQEGSPCSIWAWSNGVCRRNGSTQGDAPLQCERAEEPTTPLPK